MQEDVIYTTITPSFAADWGADGRATQQAYDGYDDDYIDWN